VEKVDKREPVFTPREKQSHQGKEHNEGMGKPAILLDYVTHQQIPYWLGVEIRNWGKCNFKIQSILTGRGSIKYIPL